MNSPLCFFKNPLPWISVLAALLVLANFLNYGFLSILLLTSTVLILSTLIFTHSKQKPRLEKKSVTDEILRLDQDSSPHTEEVISEALVPENEYITQEKNALEEDGSVQIDDYLARSSPVILSESDCLGRLSTSEDSEVDWQSQDNMFRSPDYSDGSISDEDSLIEIALPSGHVGHKKEEPKFNLQKKLPDFAPRSFFKQHGLLELLVELNEMNEEENLIEIDISMGSIKCPRFEIEA